MFHDKSVRSPVPLFDQYPQPTSTSDRLKEFPDEIQVFRASHYGAVHSND
jgi:hypothetical protein